MAKGGGGPSTAPDISARAHLTATFAANLETPIAWDVVDYDTANFFNLVANATLITIPQTGKYILGTTAGASFNAGNSLAYSVNGGAGVLLTFSNTTLGGGGSDQIQLAAGDVIEILYQCTGGGAVAGSFVYIRRVA